jgi:hypothetical protein
MEGKTVYSYIQVSSLTEISFLIFYLSNVG